MEDPDPQAVGRACVTCVRRPPGSGPSTPKLQALRVVLEECGRQEGDARRVVFSYLRIYADSVACIARHVESTARAAAYQGHIATCASSGSSQEAADVYREPSVAAGGFAPRSTRPPPDAPDAPDRFDLPLATDVLAEGQRLQQAVRFVNFDLPWNPVRMPSETWTAWQESPAVLV